MMEAAVTSGAVAARAVATATRMVVGAPRLLSGSPRTDVDAQMVPMVSETVVVSEGPMRRASDRQDGVQRPDLPVAEMTALVSTSIERSNSTAVVIEDGPDRSVSRPPSRTQAAGACMAVDSRDVSVGRAVSVSRSRSPVQSVEMSDGLPDAVRAASTAASYSAAAIICPIPLHRSVGSRRPGMTVLANNAGSQPVAWIPMRNTR